VELIDFDNLDATEFEEFCFDLLQNLPRVTSVDWRKGTGRDASPADRGRDIVAQVERDDLDETRHAETWFVECKHYKRGVPPGAVQSLLAWAHAERPHVVLVIASNFLSNATKDYLQDYDRNNRPPFRIKYWEGPVLARLAEGKRDLLARFLLTGIRSESEIIEAEDDFYARVWHERHLVFQQQYERGEAEGTSPETYEMAMQVAARLRERRPDIRPVENDFEWGMWNGKLSALRWVLGEDWDMLDT
jgi:Restriction endonuclease